MNEKKKPLRIVKLEKIENSRHGGPYYVTTVVRGSRIEGSITFSPENWHDERLITKRDLGTHMVVDDLTFKNGGGWRAGSARFYREEDEEYEKQQET